MESERRTAAVVGVLFIIATVGSIIGSAVLGSALDGPDYLAGLSADAGRVTLAVLCFIVAATSAFATSFLLFPILRPHAEGLAAGYIGLRGFENVFYVAGAVGLLVMLTLSQDDAVGAAAPADLVALGALLAALHTWSVVIGTLIFAGLGCLTLNTVLFRSRLVPHWLSIWGLVGGVGVVTYGLLGILGFETGMGSPYMLLAMPLAFQEMVFAAWLLAKGLQTGEASHRPAPAPRVPAAV